MWAYMEIGSLQMWWYKMRSYLSEITGFLRKKWQCEDTDKGERMSCDDKGRGRCYIPASKGHQGLPTNHQEKSGFPHRFQKDFRVGFRSMDLLTLWFWTCRLQNLEIISLCCFKSPVLWYFVMAAPGNKDSLYSDLLGNQVETRHFKSSIFLKDLQM